MAQDPGRKRKSMIRTTLDQEQKSAKKDPKGAESTAKAAKTIGAVIMNLAPGAALPAIARNISSAVMKQLSKRQLTKLKKLKNKKNEKDRRDEQQPIDDDTDVAGLEKEGIAYRRKLKLAKALAKKKALGKADVRSGGQVKGSSSMYMQN